jgi:hypothetical protein
LILYLSGNFPQLRTGKEKGFKDDLLNAGKPYHRLVTFFYPRDCETVFDLVKEEQARTENSAVKAEKPTVVAKDPVAQDTTVQASKSTVEEKTEEFPSANPQLSFLRRNKPAPPESKILRRRQPKGDTNESEPQRTTDDSGQSETRLGEEGDS